MNTHSVNGSSDSRNAVNWIIDVPGDGKIRPCDPKMLPILKAESEKIKRCEALMRERQRLDGETPMQKS